MDECVWIMNERQRHRRNSASSWNPKLKCYTRPVISSVLGGINNQDVEKRHDKCQATELKSQKCNCCSGKWTKEQSHALKVECNLLKLLINTRFSSTQSRKGKIIAFNLRPAKVCVLLSETKEEAAGKRIQVFQVSHLFSPQVGH